MITGYTIFAMVSSGAILWALYAVFFSDEPEKKNEQQQSLNEKLKNLQANLQKEKSKLFEQTSTLGDELKKLKADYARAQQ
ncbi:MAG: hypothetical protein KKE91_02165, partial [Candidatus Omnitrophica bacterium]|nr:hypothetical protein [Candidatus Omnitrophota bacterium]